MLIETFIVGMYETNCYIIYDEKNLEACIIDPGDEAKRLIKFIDSKNLVLNSIVLTHYHYDHIVAVEELKKKYGSQIYCHKKEVEGLKDAHINGSIIGKKKAIEITSDKLLSDGNVISIGQIDLEVIHTPGHTPGGICLKVKDKNIIFTGDTIFSDDLGRTDLIGGSEEVLKKTITNKVSKWQDNIIIYPGHGDICSMKEVRGRKIQYLTSKAKS